MRSSRYEHRTDVDEPAGFRTSDPYAVKTAKGRNRPLLTVTRSRDFNHLPYWALPERSGRNAKVGRKVGRIDRASGEGSTHTEPRRPAPAVDCGDFHGAG